MVSNYWHPNNANIHYKYWINKNFTHSVMLTTLQRFNRHIWLFASILDIVDLDHFHHHKNFYWTVLAKTKPLILLICKARPLKANWFIGVPELAGVQFKPRYQISCLCFIPLSITTYCLSTYSCKCDVCFGSFLQFVESCWFQRLCFIALIWRTGKLQWKAFMVLKTVISRAWI